jgi:prepilin-type processing-associated H-X9-DG protein
MHGMFYYIADHEVFPGTHSLFYFQSLFGSAWTRPAGVTWDGARDRLVDLTYTPAYVKPYHLDPEFVADVPTKGTIFKYLKDARVYTCPADKPGPADDSAIGGGGNGRLSYSLNAYIGYRAPDQLRGFTYVADSLDNPLPGGQKTRNFKAGQHVAFAAARYMTMFEDHPNWHTNAGYPDGNFNCIDRIATRHMPTAGAKGESPRGQASIAFLDGHAEGPTYPARTEGRELFAEFVPPYFWRRTGQPDRANMSVFIRNMRGPCPW